MRKRSITLKGHRTSVSLEAEFWGALEMIARTDGKPLPGLIYEVDRARLQQAPPPGLASALRVYVLNWISKKPPVNPPPAPPR